MGEGARASAQTGCNAGGKKTSNHQLVSKTNAVTYSTSDLHVIGLCKETQVRGQQDKGQLDAESIRAIKLMMKQLVN